MNCCLFNVKDVLTGGFEMGNLWYNEPKTLEVAFDVIGDIVLSAASQQYGGFTVPSVDLLLEPFAEKKLRKILSPLYRYGSDRAHRRQRSHEGYPEAISIRAFRAGNINSIPLRPAAAITPSSQ